MSWLFAETWHRSFTNDTLSADPLMGEEVISDFHRFCLININIQIFLLSVQTQGNVL